MGWRERDQFHLLLKEDGQDYSVTIIKVEIKFSHDTPFAGALCYKLEEVALR